MLRVSREIERASSTRCAAALSGFPGSWSCRSVAQQCWSLLRKLWPGCPNSSQPRSEVRGSQSRGGVGSEGILQPQTPPGAAAPS